VVAVRPPRRFIRLSSDRLGRPVKTQAMRSEAAMGIW